MRLGGIFCDGMILQHGKPIRVFGEAQGEVNVTFDGETKTFTADGKWLIEFPAHACGGPYELTAACGSERITVHDVMVGEVILCAGQSNMQLRMAQENTPASEYITDPLLRIYDCPRPEACEQLKGWVSADAAEVEKWSALGYLIGIRARKAAECAVGVVIAAQGASMIHSWIDESIYLPSELALDESLMHPDVKYPLFTTWNKPAMLYHYILEKLFAYSFGSVVWYQGESNTAPAEAAIYDKLLSMMIVNWREKFMDETLPFCLIQIADYDHPFHKGGWREVQAAQLRAAETISRTVCVKSADISQTDDIHPHDKSQLAERVFDALCENGFIGGTQ